MNFSLFECVPNLSEGRDPERVKALVDIVASVPGVVVLHCTSDSDHHRSVITFAGTPTAVSEAAFQLAAAAAVSIDLNSHRGVHPRLGSLDVLPFVPLTGSTMADCVALAHATGARIWNELGVPVYFYESAALRPERQRLEDVRRGGFEGIRQALDAGDRSRAPDLGDRRLHPSAGAVIVGARPFLIAYNINLQTTDLAVAKDIARRIRTSSGGFPCVKALGLPLASRGLVQVSMNLTNFEITPIDAIFAEVSRLAALAGLKIAESELVGLVPRRAMEGFDASAVRLTGFSVDRIVENRLQTALTKTGIRIL